MKKLIYFNILTYIVVASSFAQEYKPVDPRLTQFQDLMLNKQAEVTLDMANEVFKTTPPQIPEPIERTLALYLLDVLFHDVYAPQRLPVQAFLQNRIENMAEEIENTKVEEGAIIWKLYSHSFVVRTREVTIGFDLIRPSRRFENFLTDTKAEVGRIIDQCDVLFISHEHSDHADEWVAQRFIEQGKPVVAPPSVFKDQPYFSKLKHLDRDPNKLHTLHYQEGNKSLKVVVYPGHQAELLNNVPVIYTPDGFCFSHTGDQNFRDINAQDTLWIQEIKNNHQIDVLMYNPYMSQNLLKGFNPKLIISGHENEMGHGIQSRFPYWRIKERLMSLPYPFIVMTWGEKYKYVKKKIL
jgi:hypothetical protein